MSANNPEAKETPKRIYTLDEAIEAASKLNSNFEIPHLLIDSAAVLFFHSTEIGKYQLMLIVMSGLCAMGGSIENLSISVVMPYAKCDLNLSTVEHGLLTSVSFLGIFATLHVSGFLADTFGRQRVLRVCVTGGFIFSFLSAFAFDIVALIVLRFLAGAL